MPPSPYRESSAEQSKRRYQRSVARDFRSVRAAEAKQFSCAQNGASRVNQAN